MNDFDIPVDKKSLKSKEAEAAGPANEKEDTSAKKDTPAKKWTDEELASIFDHVIFSGSYEETISIRGRLKIKLRTRTVEEMDALQAELDGARLNLISTVEQKRSILNLEQALVMYDGKDLSVMKMDEKKKFIGKIPGPVVSSLLNCLQEFDVKVFEACRHGEENF